MSKTPYRYFPVLSPVFRSARRLVRRISYKGDAVTCPCCEMSFSRWLGKNGDARCPNCAAATRQKILVECLKDHGGKEQTLRTLYFAPDYGPLCWLRARPRFALTTADLSAPGVDRHWDITDIPADNASFDLIVCCHVLEHVPNDRQAMSELQRILAEDGTLYLQVPYARDEAMTDEDPSVTDPVERQRRFGQFDHVRKYGQDLLFRLADAGFSVTVLTAQNMFSPERMKSLGLWNDIIFICKPNTKTTTAERTERQS